jgi:hypothetical protein
LSTLEQEVDRHFTEVNRVSYPCAILICLSALNFLPTPSYILPPVLCSSSSVFKGNLASHVDAVRAQSSSVLFAYRRVSSLFFLVHAVVFHIPYNPHALFPVELWDSVCRELLFPIFTVLRSSQDLSRSSTQEDMSVWLSVTMIQALRNLINLYTF